VLVSIFLEGGWDALSVLAPVKEARYRELRPTLGLAEGTGKVFAEDENLMWHPAAGGLAELGRRPEENGSGTDHGGGGAAFLIGSRASGKMVGEFPGLSNLDVNDNVLTTSDFRAMYCSLLEQWFQTEAGLVIPGAGSFERPVLVK
jgi:uncharacterized protein (DUF1501 family)